MHRIEQKPVSLSQPKSIDIDKSVKVDIVKKYPSLVVTGIVWDKEDPIALVNGRFVREKD